MQYQYYGAGLLSNFDKFSEHQKAVMGNRKKKKKEKVEVKKRGRKPNKDKIIHSAFNVSNFCILFTMFYRRERNTKKNAFYLILF